jgi:mono/diheme cytochrome c family protein
MISARTPVTVFFTAILLGGMVHAAEKDPLKPRVPAEQLPAAKEMKNPVPAAAESVAKGKELYLGKGGCVACHGVEGDGKGPGAMALTPPPRDLHNPEWQRARTDGELKWVIENGSPGTGMLPFKAQLTDREMWHLVNYIRSLGEQPE